MKQTAWVVEAKLRCVGAWGGARAVLLLRWMSGHSWALEKVCAESEACEEWEKSVNGLMVK